MASHSVYESTQVHFPSQARSDHAGQLIFGNYVQYSQSERNLQSKITQLEEQVQQYRTSLKKMKSIIKGLEHELLNASSEESGCQNL